MEIRFLCDRRMEIKKKKLILKEIPIFWATNCVHMVAYLNWTSEWHTHTIPTSADPDFGKEKRKWAEKQFLFRKLTNIFDWQKKREHGFLIIGIVGTVGLCPAVSAATTSVGSSGFARWVWRNYEAICYLKDALFSWLSLLQ